MRKKLSFLPKNFGINVAFLDAFIPLLPRGTVGAPLFDRIQFYDERSREGSAARIKLLFCISLWTWTQSCSFNLLYIIREVSFSRADFQAREESTRDTRVT